MGRACSKNGGGEEEEERNAQRLLVGKPERKMPLERRRCRWLDKIKKGLRQIEWGVMVLTDLAQDREQ
jgi:hypothetical protein